MADLSHGQKVAATIAGLLALSWWISSFIPADSRDYLLYQMIWRWLPL